MLFTTPSFLFGFLPALLLLYFITPEKSKNILLLAFSLLFYAWGEPIYIALLLLSIVINYTAGMALLRFKRESSQKIFLCLGVSANLGILGYYKYSDFLITSLNDFFALSIPLDNELHLPIGISFFTFQAISYLIDVYRHKASPQKNVLTLALYISLFPQLIAGPIIRYHDIHPFLNKRTTSHEDFFVGAERFILGLAKKNDYRQPAGVDR